MRWTILTLAESHRKRLDRFFKSAGFHHRPSIQHHWPFLSCRASRKYRFDRFAVAVFGSIDGTAFDITTRYPISGPEAKYVLNAPAPGQSYTGLADELYAIEAHAPTG